MSKVDSQADQVLPSPFRFLPVVPYTIPESIAYPTVNFPEFALDSCHTEVIEPTLWSDFQLPHTFRKRFWSSFPGYGFEVLFERFPALITHHQLVFAFSPLTYVGTNLNPSISKSTGRRMPLFSRLIGSFNLSLRKR